MVRPEWGENSRSALEDVVEEQPVVVVPTGAIEQHGSHLPVDTDTSIAAAIASSAAERTEGVVATPPLSFGYSPHHGGVPGTITLRSETFTAVVRDVLGSIYEDGFERIVVLNGHGGNRAVLQTAISDFRADHGVSVALVSYWDLIEEEISEVRDSGAGGVSHGGEMETSLQLYLREELVGQPDQDFVRDDRGGYARTDLFGSGAVYYPGHFDEKTESGVSGTPSAASVEKGEQLFESSVDAVATFLREYRTW